MLMISMTSRKRRDKNQSVSQSLRQSVRVGLLLERVQALQGGEGKAHTVKDEKEVGGGKIVGN